MTVYLDNNVFVDIEMGTYAVGQFLSCNSCVYYYSDVHMNELLEGRGNSRISQEGRIELIAELCGTNCILTGILNPPEFFEREPKEMYRLSDTPLRSYISQLSNKMDNTFSKLRQYLGFDSMEFNNEDPGMVLQLIDRRMQERLGMNLLSYLVKTEGLGGKALYNTLFNIIDSANFWADKKTSRSNAARLNDASHVYCAQICDVLVTNDKRMRKKTEAAYALLGVKTRVLAVDFFFDLAQNHASKQ